jgi:hypothetical protein
MVVAFDLERQQHAEADGRFEFFDVRPGIFALRCCWLENRRDIRFISTTLQLLPGSALDLGDLKARTGWSVAVTAVLEDTAGRAVAPADVFATAAVSAGLTLSACPDSRELAETLGELSLLPFDQQFVLHGIPAGRLRLAVRPPPGADTLPGVVEVRASETLDARVEQLGEVRLALRVVRGVTIPISLCRHDGTPVDLDVIQVRDRRTGRFDAVEVQRDAGGPGRAITLAPGSYDLFAAVMHGDRGECGTSSLELSGGEARHVDLPLLPAASADGTLVDANGAPVAGRVLRWTLPTWADARIGLWLFTTTTGADGRFSIGGLPPGVQLVPSAATPSLPPLPAGAHAGDLVLIAER